MRVLCPVQIGLTRKAAVDQPLRPIQLIATNYQILACPRKTCSSFSNALLPRAAHKLGQPLTRGVTLRDGSIEPRTPPGLLEP